MKIVPFFKAVMMVFRLGPEKVLEMEKKALFDALTGFYNQGMLEETGSKEVERAKRYKHPLSVIFLDMDNLKPINDRLGHLAGDRALRKIADFLRRICRSTDIIFRYGGDEFVIIAPETEKKGAERLIQRIRAGSLFIETDDGKKIPVRMSCGLAVWYQGLLFNDLLKRADQRMYEDKNSKKEGKNRNQAEVK